MVSPLYISLSPSADASLYFALASVATTSPISFNKSSSKVAPKAMACGKTVAVPALATPCKPSFHQLYSGTPKRSIAGAS